MYILWIEIQKDFLGVELKDDFYNTLISKFIRFHGFDSKNIYQLFATLKTSDIDEILKGVKEEQEQFEDIAISLPRICPITKVENYRDDWEVYIDCINNEVREFNEKYYSINGINYEYGEILKV